jgi:hypothetical protein
MLVVDRELTVRLELLSVETCDHCLCAPRVFQCGHRESRNRAGERLDEWQAPYISGALLMPHYFVRLWGGIAMRVSPPPTIERPDT